ncbi:MAG: hypothetical protein ACO3JL_09065, partial [Myxococcota bacterium]
GGTTAGEGQTVHHLTGYRTISLEAPGAEATPSPSPPSAQLRPLQEVRAFVVNGGATNLRLAATRAQELGVLARTVPDTMPVVSTLSRNAEELGSRTPGVIGAMRFVDAYRFLEEGFRERDTTKKLQGLKELSLGVRSMPSLSRLCGFLGPAGLLLWCVLSAGELKRSSKNESLEGEAQALGWTSLTAGWFLSSVASGPVIAALSRSLGLVGSGFLLLKDMKNLLDGYREKDTPKRFEALAQLGMDAGLVGLTLGATTAGTALMFAGLGPLLLYRLSPRVRDAVAVALAAVDKSVGDKMWAAGGESAMQQIEQAMRPLSRRLKALERKLLARIIDEPAERLLKHAEPTLRTLDRRVGEPVDAFITAAVFDNLARLLQPVDHVFGELLASLKGSLPNGTPAQGPLDGSS